MIKVGYSFENMHNMHMHNMHAYMHNMHSMHMHMQCILQQKQVPAKKN